MNDFKGMSRDTVPSKVPSEMWYFARNILLTGKYLSVTNERGNEYGYSIPGVVIGYIISNDHLIYFSIDGSYSCIGYVDTNTETYTPVIRTINENFKFKLNCPIEGVYIYNYKKELIVVITDGVNKNSNTPKLINLHNPQVPLTPEKEFVNNSDYVMFELFNHIELPSSKIQYNQGSLDAEVVHLAFCYVYDDNTDTLFSPIIDTAYPNFKGYNTSKRNVTFTLQNLSSNFKKIKLAFVIKKSGGTFGYTTNILTIREGRVEFTLSSEEDLTEATVEEIVISPERFSKIKTITKTATQIEIGNVAQKDPINFQKYANKLNLLLKMVPMGTEGETYKSHPSLLPDEVYSINVVPIYKDGTKAGAFHIPGRKLFDNEREVIPEQDFEKYGLNFTEFKTKGYRRFHLENHGQINSDGTCRFGAWENEAVYPSKDYFNSSDIGGDDLRGKPIRYHRIPSLDKMDSSYYTSLKPRADSIIDQERIGYMPKFFIEVENFDYAFPPEIKELLQGYEIVIEKRSTSGSYVETNGFLYKAVIPTSLKIAYSIAYSEKEVISGDISSQDDYKDFSTSFFSSVETTKDKININANILKVYSAVQFTGYAVRGKELPFGSVMPSLYNPSTTLDKIAAIKDAKYLLANNTASGNRFGEERLQLQLKHKGINDPDDNWYPLVAGNKDLNILYVSLITLNKDIYNLENNNDFISMGIYLFNKENEPMVNGDVFTSSIIKKSFTAFYITNGIKVNPTIYNFFNYYLYNMYSPISNQFITNGATEPKPDYWLARVFPNQNSFSDRFGAVYKDWRTEDMNEANGFDYTTTVKGANLSNWFNDYVEALPPTLTENFVSYFPYRVYMGLEIPNESLQTKNLRFFPTNQYYDMRNDSGEIIALRGFNTGLYIQQRYSLFRTSIANRLNISEQETFLGSTKLFEHIPEEIYFNNDIGYIGSNSQYACYMTKDGYVTVDEEGGKIFLVSKDPTETSYRNMKTAFIELLPLGNHYTKTDLLGNVSKIDNPFLSIGYIVGYDEDNNRLLFTKKYYKPKPTTEGLKFDGEFYYDELGNIIDFKNGYYFEDKSFTFSYALDSNTWVAQHDYFPNGYIYYNKGTFSILNTLGKNTEVYKHNSVTVNPSNFYGKQYESYIDPIFNSRLDLIKQYQSITWLSDSIDMNTGRTIQFETINKVMVYNTFQSSGVIELNPTNKERVRYVEGKWQLNEFRDMMRSPDMKVVDEEGNINTSALTTNKAWYDKGLFIANYISVRLIWDNSKKIQTHVNNINVKSVISQK